METPVKLRLTPDQIRRFSFAENPNADVETLALLGIGMDEAPAKKIMEYAFDVAPDLITSASISNQLQFFQHIMPETIEVVTQKRVSDDLLGMTVAGNWYDEEVVFRVKESTGQAVPYSDVQNVPLASWNLNFVKRTVVRAELGLRVGTLESERAGVMRISSEDAKRASVAEALEIFRNLVNFYGYYDGVGKTFGILNAPELPAYITVSEGASNDTAWATKTFDEIYTDIKNATKEVRVKSGYNFDPFNDAFELWIAGNCIDYLNVSNSLGTTTLREFLAKTYPKLTIKAVPQFAEADAGENVFYLVVNNIGGRRPVSQYMQAKLRLIGQMPLTKGFEEDYTNATAGFACTQPLGVGRFSGI